MPATPRKNPHRPADRDPRGAIDEIAALVGEATRLAVAARRELPVQAIVEKDDGSIVTAVDVALQVFLLRRLGEMFGLIPTIAEEGPASIGGKRSAEEHCAGLLRDWGVADPSDQEQALASGAFDAATSEIDACWVLDPIDGTQGFVDGAHWCVCLALLSRGRPVVAINGHPTVGDGIVLAAEAGSGCRGMALRGGESRRLTISQEPLAPTDPVRIVVPARATPRQLESRLAVARAIGRDGVAVHSDSQAKYAHVIVGCADLAFSRRGAGPGQYVWDHAGAVLLAREAGAWVGDVDGGEIDCSTGRRLSRNSAVICASRSLGPEVARVLAERDRSEGLPSRRLGHA